MSVPDDSVTPTPDEVPDPVEVDAQDAPDPVAATAPRAQEADDEAEAIVDEVPIFPPGNQARGIT